MSSKNADFTTQRRGKAAQTNKTQPPAAETTTPIGEEVTDAPTVSAAQTARTEKKTPPTVTAGKTGKAKGRPKTGKETLSKRVALTVKPSVYAALTERAEAADTTVNALINKVLNEYLINT